MFKLLKESWLSLTLVLVILATVCTATFAWREDLDKVSLTAKSVLLNAKMDLANNAESDLGVLNLAALQDGQTAYIPFQMENYSNIPSAVSFRVLVKDANGEEITDALEGWEVSILSEGEPLKFSEDGTSFIAEVPAVEDGSEINAYTLQLKAASDADYSELGTEDAQLYVTADIRILEEETVQE